MVMTKYIGILFQRIRLDPRHDVNGFVHVMHYVNSIFHVMVSDGLAAAVEQVGLHGHDGCERFRSRYALLEFHFSRHGL